MASPQVASGELGLQEWRVSERALNKRARMPTRRGARPTTGPRASN